MTKRPFRALRPRPHLRRGLTVIWMIVFFLMLLVFAAFGIEMGWLRVHYARAQLAAEASALAAVGTLVSGRPEAAMSAVEIAAANIGTNDTIILVAQEDNGGGDLRFGRWYPESNIFESALLAPDAVEVTVRLKKDHPNGPVPLLFGNFVGATAADVSARAIAQARPREPVPPALIVLNEHAPGALTVLRNATIESNGLVGVASESPEAIDLRNYGSIKAALTTVQGGLRTDSDDSLRGMLRDRVEIGTVPAYLPLPLDSLPTRPDILPQPGEVLVEPGFYPNGLVAASGTYSLRDGIYLFGGPGIVLEQNATLAGENVIVVLDNGANLSLTDSRVFLASPQLTDRGNPLTPWAGLALSAAPDAEPLIQIGRHSQVGLDGSMHCPEAQLVVEDAELKANVVVVDSVQALNHALIEVGGPDPHPVDLLIVR